MLPWSAAMGVQPGGATVACSQGVEHLNRIPDVHTWQGSTLAIFLDCASRHMYFLLGSHPQTPLAPCKSRLFPLRHDWAEPVSLEGRPASNVLRKQHVARVLSPSRARTPSPVRVLALPLLQALPFSHVCVCVMCRVMDTVQFRRVVRRATWHPVTAPRRICCQV